MKTAGIICEYNPIHFGHACHIEKTRAAMGDGSGIVCAMSGNYVQRGDFAVFGKQTRAEAAVRCGADLVVEIPTPYVLSSAEGFAASGVYILDKLSICDHLSFGSESGDIEALKEVAVAIVSEKADALTREWLGKGLPYASALQKAADEALGGRSEILRSPNNLLGVEYLKALSKLKSSMQPITVRRTEGAHGGETGYSASAVRKEMLCRNRETWHNLTCGQSGEALLAQPFRSRLCRNRETWQDLMPQAAADVFAEEIAKGRGPVSMKSYEQAMLSRLRALGDFSNIPGASEGLDRRFSRYTASEPTISGILESIKTKRYAMSRIRRMLICACLGITAADVHEPPPYIRVLAMNRMGMRLLKEAHGHAELPIITKPASAGRILGRAAEIFKKESAATDFYVLSYQDENERRGGQEWRKTPVVIDK